MNNEGALLILLGLFTTYQAGRILVDSKYAAQYTQKSYKAWLWRKLFGEDKAAKIIRTFFAPIGVALGLGFTIVGVYLMVG